jgi:excisionase family DNA binding protein
LAGLDKILSLSEVDIKYTNRPSANDLPLCTPRTLTHGINRAMLLPEVRHMETLDLRSSSTSSRVDVHIGRSVSLDQAAQLLNVSRRTIYNRIREGRLQTIRTRGGSQRVLLNSIQDATGETLGASQA